jgi:hypothetical protein
MTACSLSTCCFRLLRLRSTLRGSTAWIFSLGPVRKIGSFLGLRSRRSRDLMCSLCCRIPQASGYHRFLLVRARHSCVPDAAFCRRCRTGHLLQLCHSRCTGTSAPSQMLPILYPSHVQRWLWVALTSSLHLLCSITTHTHTIGFSFLWKTTETTPSIPEDLAYNTPPSFMPPARSQLCPLGGVSGFQLVYPILAIRSAICGKPDVCGRCRPTRSPLPIADIRFLPALSLKIARLSLVLSFDIILVDGTGYSSFDSPSWNKPESDSLFYFRSTLIFFTSVTGPGLESPRSRPGTTWYVPAFVSPNAKSSNIFVNTRSQHLRHPHYWSV